MISATCGSLDVCEVLFVTKLSCKKRGTGTRVLYCSVRVASISFSMWLRYRSRARRPFVSIRYSVFRASALERLDTTDESSLLQLSGVNTEVPVGRCQQGLELTERHRRMDAKGTQDAQPYASLDQTVFGLLAASRGVAGDAFQATRAALLALRSHFRLNLPSRPSHRGASQSTVRRSRGERRSPGRGANSPTMWELSTRWRRETCTAHP